MNKPANIKGSLIERAAEIYDFGAALRRADPAPAPAPPMPITQPPEQPPESRPEPEELVFIQPEPAAPAFQPAESPRGATIDRTRLQAAGFIVPEAASGGLAEEFRIVKRQLLTAIRAGNILEPQRRSILVCSASPDEGKTFCAVNLALSMAGESDLEVLLVDGDVSKPSVLSILGIEDGPGLIDAIADPAADPEAFVIRTDVPGLDVLPAGRRVNNATELLSSSRGVALMGELSARHPRRIVIFDSPPALMASPAGVLAAYVGQAVMVVRADATTEAELREAVSLLSGCPNLSLLLNAAALASQSRRFGSYYGLED